MNKYQKMSKKHTLPPKRMRNCILAFISGGCVALLAQGAYELLVNVGQLSEKTSVSMIVIFIIALTSFCTGIGVYDKLAKHCGAGLFIPISGFANALTSSALESKHEGFIFGIGSNMFKLAGSVITYGIVAAYILGMIRYLVGV